MLDSDCKKMFVEVIPTDSFNAGKKAFDDVNSILKQEGFRPIGLNLKQSPSMRIVNAPASILRISAALRNFNGLVFIQSPLPREVKGLAIRMLRIKRAKVIILLHDIDSIRYDNRLHLAESELAFIDSADAIICHNATMQRWLLSRGLQKPVFHLTFFDYLVNESPVAARHERVDADLLLDWRHTIVFAGSLSELKSGFIYRLPDSYAVTVRAFGVKPSTEINFPLCVHYCGRFPPNSPVLPEGLFGLAWDGPDASTCSGTSGDYLRINSPHKISLYLACGLPIICWRESALANEIETNQLGICVDSLHEIPAALATLSEPSYVSILKNVEAMKHKLRRGEQLKKSLHLAIGSVIAARS